MKTKTTNRIRKPAHSAPALQSRADAESVLNDLVSTTLNRNMQVSLMDRAIARVREKHEPMIAACQADIEARSELLRAWPEAHPEEFGYDASGSRVASKPKSIEFATATIGFRTATPTLKTLKGWTWDRVLEKIKMLPTFVRYLRVKEEVNKQTLLIDRDGLDLAQIGLRVEQSETFFIDPNIETPENKITELSSQS